MVYRAYLEEPRGSWWQFWKLGVRTNIYVSGLKYWINAETGAFASRTVSKFLSNEMRKQQVQEILKHVKPDLKEV